MSLVDELRADPETLEGMSRAALGLARPQAARTIATDLLELLGRRPPAATTATSKDPEHLS